MPQEDFEFLGCYNKICISISSQYRCPDVLFKGLAGVGVASGEMNSSKPGPAASFSFCASDKLLCRVPTSAIYS